MKCAFLFSNAKTTKLVRTSPISPFSSLQKPALCGRVLSLDDGKQHVCRASSIRLDRFVFTLMLRHELDGIERRGEGCGGLL